MNSAERILTIDIGTSAIKVVLFDASGETLRLETRPYARARTEGLEAEQDPREWWELASRLVRTITSELAGESGSIRAVAVTGQMHGVVLVGREGPLGPVMTFQDRRSVSEHEELLAHRETIHRITGSRTDAGMVPAKLLHMKRHGGGILDEAEYLLAPKDYIRYELTGAAETDPIDAAGLLLYDLDSGEWSAPLCDLIGLDIARLPMIRPTVSRACGLKEDVARDLGLPPDAAVAVCGGDDIEALGSGMSAGDLYEHLGTSGSIYACSTRPLRDPEGRLEVYPDVMPGRYLVGGSTGAAGAAEKWLREEVSPQVGDPEEIYRQAARRGGPSSVLFLPYLAGARCPLWDPRRRGAFVGLTLGAGAGDLYEAVAEGVAYSLRGIIERLAVLGEDAGGVVYTTGGYGSSEAFGRIRADIYGREVRRITEAEATSFAAMLIAGTVAGLFDDVESAAARLREVAWSACPRPQVKAAYDAGYARFVKATERLAGV